MALDSSDQVCNNYRDCSGDVSKDEHWTLLLVIVICRQESYILLRANEQFMTKSMYVLLGVCHGWTHLKIIYVNMIVNDAGALPIFLTDPP